MTAAANCGRRYLSVDVASSRSGKKFPWRTSDNFVLKILQLLRLYPRNSFHSDVYLFPALKQNLGVHKSEDDWKVETAETRQLLKNKNLWTAIRKADPNYEKYLNFGWKCVEKQRHSSTIKHELASLELKTENPNCMHCMQPYFLTDPHTTKLSF
jgi:hypothetical protein